MTIEYEALIQAALKTLAIKLKGTDKKVIIARIIQEAFDLMS